MFGKFLITIRALREDSHDTSVRGIHFQDELSVGVWMNEDGRSNYTLFEFLKDLVFSGSQKTEFPDETQIEHL